MAYFLSPSPGSAGQLRGVDLHPQVSDHSASLIRREFALLEGARASTVRFDVFWHTLEVNAPGREDRGTLSWLDWVFRQARSHRLKVVLDVWSTPCWASSAPVPLFQSPCSYGWWNRGVMRYPPIDPQTYARFCAFLARRWGSSLAALELWNEPNGGFLVSRDPARDYASLVRAAYPAVKAVAPRLPVLMSMAGTDIDFLRELYGHGVRGSYDGIAVHPYDQPNLAGLKAFRTYQLSEGDRARLWVTEVGWSSSVWGERGQALNVASVLSQLAGLPYVAAVEIYDMRDDAADPRNPQDNFGLLDADLTPKRAWSAFANALRSLRR